MKQISFNDNTCYNFLVFDTETNTTGIAAEICQLAAIDHTGSYIFSQYVLPQMDIDACASAINNLKVQNVNNQRKLFKNRSMLPTLPLKEVLTKFESYISESIARKKAFGHNKPVITVLIGHNTNTFVIPILLRDAGEVFSNKLQMMDVWFADSLSLFRELVKCKLPSLMKSNGTFPPINQSSLYETLFQQSFKAHDALEDVIAFHRILFSSRLQLSIKTIVELSRLVSTSHAVNEMVYNDSRHRNMQTFLGKMFDPHTNSGCLKKNMLMKICGHGLTYEYLQNVYLNHGTDGLVAILLKPPSASSSNKPRVTKTTRILTVIVEHFGGNTTNKTQ